MYQIVNLIVNEGDPSKIDRSRKEALEVTTGILNRENTADLEATTNKIGGYEIMNGWTSPRIIVSHLHERHLPPDIWERKAKVMQG